jgi:DNA topoisomerase I
VGSGDVNAYLAQASGGDFTAKDFRTWAGSVRAWWALARRPRAKSSRQGRRTVNEAIQEVARRLGNTPATCRKAYVHPAIVDSYLEGTLQPRPRRAGRAAGGRHLRASETSLLRLLTSWKPEPAEARLDRRLREPLRVVRRAPKAARRRP